ncbi:MAG: YicC family protein [Planctomycetota bacterium]|nr:MAG: YicC family protein [Planctomycetota bacterium]
MMLSMTGFGEFRVQDERWNVLVEIRSVNNRHLKLVAKISEPYASLEAELERLVREKLRRGTIYLSLRIHPNLVSDTYRLNLEALRAYRKQLTTLCEEWSTPPPEDWAQLLGLPGVVSDPAYETVNLSEDWPELAKVVNQALERLGESRAREGQAMAAELSGYSKQIRLEVDRIRERLPLMVVEYADRLHDRVQSILEKHDIVLNSTDLIRELAIFSERSNVAEEITRLVAHLDQFDEILTSSQSEGRKLEFVVQEMGREINTLGAKSLDVAVSRYCVEVKSTLEKIRELILNVE